MEIFVSDDDWNNHHETPEDYARRAGVKEGEGFSLVRLTVVSKSEFVLQDGVVQQTAVAFPDKIEG